MQLIGHDYISDQPTFHKGLAGIATLVNLARAEARSQNHSCILLDNGDTLQGTVMGDLLAARPVDATHPVIACVNALRYDALGIGNHDLDYGLPYLERIAHHLNMPMISTNLITKSRSDLQTATILDCTVHTMAGDKHDILRVGILSALPTKTAIWNHHLLQGQADVAPAASHLEMAAKTLRTQGADLVVLLAHMGIDTGTPDEEDSAIPLAQIPGIDAIITGHTHQRFPGMDHANRTDVDADVGTLAKRPAIMPGYAGSDLAVLDLTLKKSDAGGWHVIGHVSKLRRNTAATGADPQITALCDPAHQMTRQHLSAEIGQTDQVIHNYFSLAMPTATAALMARAKARVVRDALAGQDAAAVPLLASVAAHTAGGRGGPNHYLSIPKGPVLRRHIAGLAPYANQIWALKMNGAELRAMLEQSANAFQRLRAGHPDQLLIDNHVPSFNFDTIFGITYQIDPTRSAGDRIKSLQYQGQLVQPHDPFILTTNQFRAAGGGGFAPFPHDAVILRSTIPPEAAMIDALAHPNDMLWPSQTPWSFGCETTVQAMLHTSPTALNHLHDAAHLSPQPCGTTIDGFAKLRLTL